MMTMLLYNNDNDGNDDLFEHLTTCVTKPAFRKTIKRIDLPAHYENRIKSFTHALTRYHLQAIMLQSEMCINQHIVNQCSSPIWCLHLQTRILFAAEIWPKFNTLVIVFLPYLDMCFPDEGYQYNKYTFSGNSLLLTTCFFDSPYPFCCFQIIITADLNFLTQLTKMA